MTGSYAGGLYGLAALCVIAAAVAAWGLKIPDVTTGAQGLPAEAD